MAKEIKHNITPEKVEKKLDKKIEKILDQELDSNFDEKIKEIVDQKLDEKINEDVSQHISKQSFIDETGSPAETQEKPPKVNFLAQELREFKTNFHLCWRGSCRIISIMTVPLYLLIILSLLACHFAQKCNTTHGTTALVALFFILAVVTVSLILSFFSSYPKTALIFWIILDIPLLIIIFVFTAQYIGLIILSLLVTLRIIQLSRGEY